MMFNCKQNPQKPCQRTSPNHSSDEQHTTPLPDDEDTTVIALVVVVVIGVLVLVVVLGIIVYRRIRSTRNAKTNLESPVQIHHRGEHFENGNSKIKDRNSGQCNGNHSKIIHPSVVGNDNTENMYSSIDECDTTRSHDYAQAIFIEGQIDSDDNDAYNRLNDIVKDDNADDYSHARVVESLQESATREGTLGEDTGDYDRLSHRPSNTGVYGSDNDYDHMDKDETLSTSL